MPRLAGYALIDGLRLETTFVSGSASVSSRGEAVNNAKVFLGDRLGQVFVGVEIEDADSGLVNAADAGRLTAIVDAEVVNGVDIITGVVVGFGARPGAAVYVEERYDDGLTSAERNLRARVALASMMPSRPRLPAPDRPVGDGEPLKIEIVGEIGVDVRATEIVGLVRSAPEATILMHVDSVGGDLAEATEIWTVLAGHEKAVFATVANASSAAVPIALVADIREIGGDGQVLLHAPYLTSFNAANAHDLTQWASKLSARAEELAQLVSARTGQPISVARDWLADETVFSAGEAVEHGLMHSVAYDRPSLTPAAIRARFAPISAPYGNVRPKSAPPALYSYGPTFARGAVVRHGDRTFIARRDALAAPGLEPDRDSSLWRRA